MSIVQIAMVFGANLGPTEMLVAIALADYADDDGRRVFPAISTIAAKVNLSRRTVQRIIRRLENVGYVVVASEGGGRGQPRRLELHPEVLEKGVTDDALSEPAKGVTRVTPFNNPDVKRASRVTRKGVTGVTQSVSNRHSSVSEETDYSLITAERGERRAVARRLPAGWLPGPALVAWAARERPDVDVGLAVARFRDYWIAVSGSRGRKLDWSATFRNWIRNEHPARAGMAERREHWMRRATGEAGNGAPEEIDDTIIIDV